MSSFVIKRVISIEFYLINIIFGEFIFFYFWFGYYVWVYEFIVYYFWFDNYVWVSNNVDVFISEWGGFSCC